MTLHVLEKLAATNPDCEIWFDSSPLVFERWKSDLLARAPSNKQSAWTQQLTRLFDAAHLQATGEMGFRGFTTNPPLSLQAIRSDPEFWSNEIVRMAAETPRPDVEAVYWRIYLQVVRRGAEMVRPAFDKSGGKYGYVSGQVDPRFVTDRAGMLEQGLQLAALAPNVMVKIPGSKEGYEVIEELSARGISTNNTTSFTVPQYLACMNAVSGGIDRARTNGVDLSRWRSVITHMSARLGNIGDLKSQAEARNIQLSPQDILHGELAVIKRAYRFGKDTKHPSKMLQCSMRVIDNGPGGTTSSWHIEKLAGGDFVYTCPPAYIEQLMQAEDRFPRFQASAIDEEAPTEAIDKLMRIPYFRQAYEPDGMRPEEFSRYGAFVATAAEFAAATRKTVDFVTLAMEAIRRRAA